MVTDPAVLESYRRDQTGQGMLEAGMPAAMVRPRATPEVSGSIPVRSQRGPGRPPHPQEVVRFDLTSPFCGSWGTLGIVTEATLRLMPKPPPPATLAASFESAAAAGEAVARISTVRASTASWSSSDLLGASHRLHRAVKAPSTPLG